MPRLKNYTLNALAFCLVIYVVGLFVFVVVLFSKSYQDLQSQDYKEWEDLNKQLSADNEAANEDYNWSGGTMRKPLAATMHGIQSDAGEHALDASQNYSRGRRGVEFVLGIPTGWHANGQNQLIETLYSLLVHMDAAERVSTLIVVFIGEVRAAAVQQIVSQITVNFRPQLTSGLIDIITAKQNKASPAGERLSWRSKRNLDCAALMRHAQTRGRYYLQLADNIAARRGFLTYIRKTIVLHEAFQLPSQHRPWLVYSFCTLGNAGKLFKANELTELIQFLQIFHKEQTNGWLLAHYVKLKVCLGMSMPRVACQRNFSQSWLESTQSQFERIGNATVLQQHGGSKALRYLRLPLALMRTRAMQIAHSKSYAADDSDANEGRSQNEFYFWGFLPQLNGMLAHIFEHSNTRHQYRIYKGHMDMTSDFEHAVLDVLPPAQADELRSNQTPAGRREGFIVAYSFDTQQKHKVARAAFYALDNGVESGLWLRVMRNGSGSTTFGLLMNFLHVLFMLVN